MTHDVMYPPEERAEALRSLQCGTLPADGARVPRSGILSGLTRDGERSRLVSFEWRSSGFRPAGISPFTKFPTLFAEHRDARLYLHLPAGRWDVLLAAHPWSGLALLRDADRYELLDLFAAESHQGSRAFSVLSRGPDDPVIVEATGMCQIPSRGTQVWFLGVAGPAGRFHPENGEPVSEACRIVKADHGTFLTRRTDTVISNQLAATGVWEPKSLAVFERFAAGARCILDVGANIGHHSVVLSRLLAPSGRLFAFEPQKEVFHLLCANLAINGCGGAEAFRLALGASPGTARMFPISYEGFSNFGALGLQLAEGSAERSGEPVRVMTLDGFLEDQEVDPGSVGFIKLDVQSFELFVLQGAEATLRLGRPTLALEVAPLWMRRCGYDYRMVYRLLADLGYLFLEEDGAPHAVPDWDGESADEWNIVALPPDRR